MEKKHTLTTRKIVFAALMAALTVAGSALRVTLPLDIAGTTSFHLGNIIMGVRVEDLVLVTDHGHEILNHFSKELTVID